MSRKALKGATAVLKVDGKVVAKIEDLKVEIGQSRPKDVDDWLSEWEGSMACGCGHGCLAWIEKNHSKAALIMRAQRLGSKKSILDRISQMPIERANKIWFWIYHREMIYWNRQMQEGKWSEEANSKAIQKMYSKRMTQ